MGERAIRRAAGCGDRAGGATAGRWRRRRSRELARGAPAAPRPRSSDLFAAYRSGDSALRRRCRLGPGRSWSGRRPRTRSAVAVEAVRRASTVGAGRSCWCPRRCRCRRPRRGSWKRSGGRSRSLRRRGQAGAISDVARDRGRPVRRRGGHAAGGVRADATMSALIVVSRESHPAHREDRAPYYHVRDVALKRAELDGARVRRSRRCARPQRQARSASPRSRRRHGGGRPVEVVRAGPEGRAPRLVRALRETRRGFIFAPLPGIRDGAGLPLVRRPGGVCGVRRALRSEEGIVRCIVCEAPGRCAQCGAMDFGLRRGGAERVEEWAAIGRAGAGPSRRDARQGPTAEGERDPRRRPGVGPGPRARRPRARRRPRCGPRRAAARTRRRASARWRRGWRRSAGHGRRAGRSSRPTARRPGDPGAGAREPGSVPRGRGRAPRRGGVPGRGAVFRIAGSEPLEAAARGAWTPSRCSSRRSEGRRYACSRSSPRSRGGFGRTIRDLAARDIVERVEAEPHL